MTRVLPRRRVRSAWPSALLILWAPVWARSSRLRYSRRRGIGVGPRTRRGDQPCGLGADGVGQSFGAVERGRATGEGPEQLAQLGPEDRVLAERVVGRLELLEGRHQRLRHVAPAEVALQSPSAGAIGVEQRGMDRRRAEREVRAVVASGSRPLDEQGDPERVLDRSLAGDARTLHARRDVDPDGRDRAQGPADVGRVEAAGQGDRHLAGDRRGEPFRGPRAGPAGMQPAGRVEEDPVGAAGEMGPSARHEVVRLAREGRAARRRAGGAPSRSGADTRPRHRPARSRSAGRRPGRRRRWRPPSGPGRRPR